MVRVAVAGGTGGLGRTIVEAFEEGGTHEVIVLTRKTGKPSTSTTGSGTTPSVAMVPIDYTDPESIARTLDEYRVHTVISTIVIKSEEQRDAQLNLIRGSDISSSVKRFTPSEFGTPRALRQILASSPTDFKSQAIAELEASSSPLEYTLFSHGVFMDYQGMPRIRSHLTPWVFAIDLRHRTTGIPGSGDVACVYTYSRDVARFVVAAVGLPDGTWRKQSLMVGQRQTLNEILRTAESVLGKFEVKYDSLEKLQEGQITLLPSHRELYEVGGGGGSGDQAFQGRFAGFGVAMEQGAFDFEVPPAAAADDDVWLLNDLFPEIRPKTMREVIEEGWA